MLDEEESVPDTPGLNLKEFILTVKGYPTLYKNKNASDITFNIQITLWGEIAQKMGLENGEMAKEKWRILKTEYLEYLFYDKPFRFAQEMQFMQEQLLLDGPDSDMELQLSPPLTSQSMQTSKGSTHPAYDMHQEIREKDPLASVDPSYSSKNLNKSTSSVETLSEDEEHLMNTASDCSQNTTSIQAKFSRFARKVEQFPRPLQLEIMQNIERLIEAAIVEMQDERELLERSCRS